MAELAPLVTCSPTSEAPKSRVPAEALSGWALCMCRTEAAIGSNVLSTQCGEEIGGKRQHKAEPQGREAQLSPVGKQQ